MPAKTSSGPRGKPATRQLLLARRDALTAEARADGSARICDAANDLLAGTLGAAGVLALYASKGSEVDTAGIEAFAGRLGLVTAYPRVVDGARILAFHAAQPDELAVTPRFGLREPRADAPVVALADITAFIIPGLAFDRDGGRIGWGRGYYDATLALAPDALRIGLAFECQVVRQVPRDPHDVALHYLITETQTLAVA